MKILDYFSDLTQPLHETGIFEGSIDRHLFHTGQWMEKTCEKRSLWLVVSNHLNNESVGFHPK